MAGPPPLRSDDLREGALFAGKYRVDRMLGRGGMGLVALATHVGLGQRVAIKVVLPTGLLVPGMVERFEREAKAAAALHSEHVVKVVDIGHLGSGAPYLIMEYLEGSDLSRVLERRGPLSHCLAVDLILQAIAALAEAHARGIVHRDLKPANLFLLDRPEGVPFLKVLDFGLSKMRDTGASTDSLTSVNMVAGSPHYMSPEQVRSLKGTDARTDVWALGVVLFELLTGRRPFEGETNAAVLVAVTADPVPSPRRDRQDLPEDLERTIMRCLEKDVSRRVQTVVELAELLSPFASRRGLEAVEHLLSPRVASTARAPEHEPSSAQDSSAVTTIPYARGDAHAADELALASTDPEPRGVEVPMGGATVLLQPVASPPVESFAPLARAPQIETLPSAAPPLVGGWRPAAPVQAVGPLRARTSLPRIAWFALGAGAIVALGIVGFLISRGAADGESAPLTGVAAAAGGTTAAVTSGASALDPPSSSSAPAPLRSGEPLGGPTVTLGTTASASAKAAAKSVPVWSPGSKPSTKASPPVTTYK